MIRCVLAENSLSVHNGGHVSICNGSRQMFTADGNTITLDKYTLHDAWNSPTRLEIIDALANDIQHENCVDCWTKEAAGFPSMRLIHNQDLNKLTTNQLQPQVLILKPGNVCNLGCRHCDSQVSSGWYKDDHALNYSNISYEDYLKKFSVTRNSYKDDNPSWAIIENWANNIIHWDLYGAEPLLIKPLLNALGSANSNASIHINTNGTIWRDEFVKLFKKFKSVSLDISVDGIHEQFDYLRYPATFNTVLENILKYKNISSNIKVSVTVTVSIYNILDLGKILKFFNEYKINCSFNLLHNPEYMNIRALPDNSKLEVAEQVNEKFKHPLAASIIDFMKMPLDKKNLINEFMSITYNIDKQRNQRFAITFPEMYKLLKQYE